MVETEIGVGYGMRWSLKGMTALVTGGTRGIGHAFVEELGRFGALIYTCSRKQDELDECLEQRKSKGFQVAGSVCDVSSRPQRENLMETVAGYFNEKINILDVNNAGICILKEAIEFTTDYSMLMSTNFEARFHLSQIAYPFLKASGNGNVVFISSVCGLIATSLHSLYSATKGAINQITKNAWHVSKLKTISVLLQSHHRSSIPQWSKPTLELKEKELVEGFIAQAPMRCAGEPSEVLALVAIPLFPCCFIYIWPDKLFL